MVTHKFIFNMITLLVYHVLKRAITQIITKLLRTIGILVTLLNKAVPDGIAATIPSDKSDTKGNMAPQKKTTPQSDLIVVLDLDNCSIYTVPHDKKAAGA
jgi:hypothetical protein